MTPVDARRPVSVKPDLGCPVGAEVAGYVYRGRWPPGAGCVGVGRAKLEQVQKAADLAESDGFRRLQSHGEALRRGETTCGPLPRGTRAGILERGPCRHPLAALLATRMDLEVVVQVDCAAGCGHRLYSDRGPFECPSHWPAAKVAQEWEFGYPDLVTRWKELVSSYSHASDAEIRAIAYDGLRLSRRI